MIRRAWQCSDEECGWGRDTTVVAKVCPAVCPCCGAPVEVGPPDAMRVEPPGSESEDEGDEGG